MGAQEPRLLPTPSNNEERKINKYNSQREDNKWEEGGSMIIIIFFIIMIKVFIR